MHFAGTTSLLVIYTKDEYVDNDHWTPQVYISEARRMVGGLVMTQHHGKGGATKGGDRVVAANAVAGRPTGGRIVNSMLSLDQRGLCNRLLLALPLFALAFGISLMDFGVIWRYFA